MKKVFIKKAFTIASTSPCGHCGSGYNQLSCHGGARPDGTPVNLAYHVSCRKCRASGPIAPSAEEAVKGWEHRAPPRQNEEPPALLPEIEFEGKEEESGVKPEDGTNDHARLMRQERAAQAALMFEMPNMLDTKLT